MKTYLIILVFISTNLFSQDSLNYPVYFITKEYKLDTTEEKKLLFFIHQMKKHTVSQIQINAYADDIGKTKRNDKLSKDRARFLDSTLRKYFDTSIKIEHAGKGPVALKYDFALDLQRQYNRKGEIKFSYKYQFSNDTSKSKNKLTSSHDNKAQISPAQEIDINLFISKAKPGDKLNLKVNFEGGRHHLMGMSKTTLDSLVVNIKNNQLKFDIQGHIYNYGIKNTINDGYDRDTKTDDLSVQRAKAVYLYLIEKGIDKSRLTYQGFGARFPLGKKTKEDMRVEILVKE